MRLQKQFVFLNSVSPLTLLMRISNDFVSALRTSRHCALHPPRSSARSADTGIIANLLQGDLCLVPRTRWTIINPSGAENLQNFITSPRHRRHYLLLLPRLLTCNFLSHQLRRRMNTTGLILRRPQGPRTVVSNNLK